MYPWNWESPWVKTCFSSCLGKRVALRCKPCCKGLWAKDPLPVYWVRWEFSSTSNFLVCFLSSPYRVVFWGPLKDSIGEKILGNLLEPKYINLSRWKVFRAWETFVFPWKLRTYPSAVLWSTPYGIYLRPECNNPCFWWRWKRESIETLKLTSFLEETIKGIPSWDSVEGPCL